MNLDTFTGHLKLSDSYRKALTFIVYPLIAALSLAWDFSTIAPLKPALSDCLGYGSRLCP